MTKFIIAASYSSQAMQGFLKDPGSDRLAAANSMASQIGGSCKSITFLRGKYDFIAEFDLPSFEAGAALKVITMASGAFSKVEIMEPVDMKNIATIASKAAGSYKPVGK
jgi:uncharacterized protein with GYD domain|tara:strand:- start:517 stop:843 length:327 start_codon:yes stop_codon:yes gene_type:complete